jgi:hypothetical protein
MSSKLADFAAWLISKRDSLFVEGMTFVHSSKMDDFPDGPVALVAVGNSSVSSNVVVQPEEIVVVRHNDTLLRKGVRELLRVGCPNQSGVGRRCYVDPTLCQSIGHRVADTFIQMITNLHRPSYLRREPILLRRIGTSFP